MAVVSMAISSFAIYMLYRTALASVRSRLLDQVYTERRAIEAIARQTRDREQTLQIARNAYAGDRRNSPSGELMLVERQGDRLVLLVSSRRLPVATPTDLPPDDPLADPLQRALSGQSGSFVIRNDRGEIVFGAYEPIAPFDWAIVAQIERTSVRAPFLKTVVLTGVIGIWVVFVGVSLFFGITNKLLRELEDNEAKHRGILQAAADGILTISDRGKIHWVNQAILDIFGYPTPDELIGQNLKILMPKLVHQELDAYLNIYLNKAFYNQNHKGYEVIGKRHNGTTFPMELTVTEVRLQSGRLFTLFVRDITERKRSQEALEQSYNLLQAITEGTADPIFLKDLQGHYITINSAGAAIMGKPADEIIGKSDTDLLTPESARQIAKNDRRVMMEGQTQRVEESIVPRSNHGEIPAARTYLCTKSVYRSARGNIIGLIGVARDISDRVEAEATLRKTVERLHQTSQELQEKNQQLETALSELQRTQTQLIQTEKMSSLGQMVAGIAHEINNPVNFIYANLDHAQDYLQDLLALVDLYGQHEPGTVPEIREMAEEIELEFLREDLPKLLVSMKVGADRIREIVRNLRNFSRLDEAQMKQVDIHEGLESTLSILQNRFKAQDRRPEIALIKEYGNLPKVECYPGQLNQVFMNLLNNAIDALDLKDPPHQITIETREIAPSAGSEGFEAIAIRIADNGPGMSAEIQARLFDPFFTTKPVGKGTGLGMAISYQIVVERHGGQIECVSEPGRGTEFTVTIPIRQSRYP
ncbi:MAG: PAS domain S-box protein [Cyanobacteria bacterium J007]|nr:MAG: PAS domain S-box protein [Cyanobacteria bacterium J007]